MPASPKTNAQLVEELREKFFAEYDPSAALYHEEDVKRVRENEWYCKRFILHQRKNLDNALSMMKDALKWRKEFGINDIKETDFPKEFYELAGIFPYTKDKHGNVLLMFRVKLHQKIPAVSHDERRFIAMWIEKLDRETNGSGASVIFDCSGAGMSNVDMEMLRFLINCFKYYYPKGLGYIYVYDMPWIFNAIWKVVKAWLPSDATNIIKFCTKKSITDYIDIDQLPDYMGGTCTKEYVLVPKECSSILDTNLWTKLTEDQMKKFIETIADNKRKLIECFDEEEMKTFLQIPEEKLRSIKVDPSLSDSLKETYIRLAVLRMQSDLIQAKLNEDKTEAEDTITDILNISPQNAVVFPKNTNGHSSVLLTLENVSTSSVAFKVQSNNPKSYRVLPSAGVIEPKATAKVDVQLLPGQKCEQKDKFLISALKLDSTADTTPVELLKLWQQKQKDVLQIKLKCVMEKGTSAKTKTFIQSTVFSNGTPFDPGYSKEVELRMMAHSLRGLSNLCTNLQRTQKSLVLLLWMVVVLLFLLVAVLGYGTYYITTNYRLLPVHTVEMLPSSGVPFTRST